MTQEEPELYIDIPLEHHDLVSSCLERYLTYSQKKFHKAEEFDQSKQDEIITTHDTLNGVKDFKAMKIASNKIPNLQQFSTLKFNESKVLENSFKYGMKRSFLQPEDKSIVKNYLGILKEAIKEFPAQK